MLDVVLPDELLILIFTYLVNNENNLIDIRNVALTCPRFRDIIKSEKCRIQRHLITNNDGNDDHNRFITKFGKWIHGPFYLLDRNLMYCAIFRKNFLHGPMIVYHTPDNTSTFNIISIRNWKDGLLHGYQLVTVCPKPKRRISPSYADLISNNTPVRVSPSYADLISNNTPVRVILHYNCGSLVEYIVDETNSNVHLSVLLSSRNLIEFYEDELNFKLITNCPSGRFPYNISGSDVVLTGTDLFLHNLPAGEFTFDNLYKMYVKIIIMDGRCLFKSQSEFKLFLNNSPEIFTRSDDKYIVKTKPILFPISLSNDINSLWDMMYQAYETHYMKLVENPFLYL